MQFELEPDNRNQPDEALLEDLRRVSEALKPVRITKDLYDAHGRWCAATMRLRFGSWNKALALAGLKPTHVVNIPREEIIRDIQRVARSLSRTALTFSEYHKNGGMTDRPIRRVFGAWAAAARAAGIEPAYDPLDLTDEICFEAIETIWQERGRQPREHEVRPPEARVAGPAITRRFGSWRKALEAFVGYMNAAESDGSPHDSAAPRPPTQAGTLEDGTVVRRESTPRNVGWRLRFLVMRRDGFRCKRCGRSPATHLGLSLVIDHHVPWSHGGPTIFDNLRTLCEECNGGRGNLADEEEVRPCASTAPST